MGTFTHSITLIAPSGTETLEALVDINTLFAVFPTHVLERLGVHADRTACLQPDGEERLRRLGQVQAELQGRQATIICAFGDDNELSRIGRHTLDTFLLEADLAQRKLVPKTLRLISHV